MAHAKAAAKVAAPVALKCQHTFPDGRVCGTRISTYTKTNPNRPRCAIHSRTEEIEPLHSVMYRPAPHRRPEGVKMPSTSLPARAVSNPPVHILPREMPLEQRIVVSVCEHYGVALGDLMSQGQVPLFVHARRMAAYLLKADTDLFVEDMAKLLKCSSSTVHNGHAHIRAELEKWWPDINFMRARYK